eukprot:706492-Hanusia_phi.AAC.5
MRRGVAHRRRARLEWCGARQRLAATGTLKTGSRTGRAEQAEVKRASEQARPEQLSLSAS